MIPVPPELGADESIGVGIVEEDELGTRLDGQLLGQVEALGLLGIRLPHRLKVGTRR